ncbi:MAG: AraC family ligand binding domain-containing protein [Gemmatimonadota bacterium]
MEILIPRIADSALALEGVRLDEGAELEVHEIDLDSLLFSTAGSGALSLAGETAAIEGGSAALVLAGEEATFVAGAGGLELIRATVGSDADRHAPMGPREVVVALDDAISEQATGARSFQILFGPHNGSARATLFAGYLPPGRAAWHYHLYDEIVWIPQGPGSLHLRGSENALGPGSAFRLRPREVHVVESSTPDREMTVIGVFTPAGSPSAAYLAPTP